MTGSKAVKDHYKGNVIHYFFPFDAGSIMKSFLGTIKPEICILMETEIWPNLIHLLNKKNIPVALINARLSEKSFNKYQRFFPKLVSESLKKAQHYLSAKYLFCGSIHQAWGKKRRLADNRKLKV
jgi:3-deoxy-D-manno-octulosonic-acid transferase